MTQGQKETLASQAWTGRVSLENLGHQECQVAWARWGRQAERVTQGLQDPQGYQARKEKLE